MEDSSPPAGIPRTCRSCGNPIEPGHTFCEVCGAKAEELPTCRKCGAIFLAPVKFCEMCGTPAMAQAPVQEPDDRMEPEPELADEPVREPEMPEPVEEPDILKPDLPERIPARTSPPVDKRIQVEDTGPVPLIREEGGRPAPERTFTRILPVAGGIMVLLIVIAGIYFIGLPMLSGGMPGLPQQQATPEPVPLAEPQPTTRATSAPETPAPLPTMPVYSLVPEPTQEMPKSQEVFFQVQKDPITAEITVIFAGGPGINSISTGDVKVTREDGTVLTGTIRPTKGVTELTLQGSKDTDRVEVIAKMYTGQTYRVIDELLSYKSR